MAPTFRNPSAISLGGFVTRGDSVLLSSPRCLSSVFPSPWPSPSPLFLPLFRCAVGVHPSPARNSRCQCTRHVGWLCAEWNVPVPRQRFVFVMADAMCRDATGYWDTRWIIYYDSPFNSCPSDTHVRRYPPTSPPPPTPLTSSSLLHLAEEWRPERDESLSSLTRGIVSRVHRFKASNFKFSSNNCDRRFETLWIKILYPVSRCIYLKKKKSLRFE